MVDSKNGLHKLREKRKSEEEEELPEDLSLKKSCTEITDEEATRQLERRQRNKEAAEKSRKKRKEEFDKLQSENVRLNQEKCELAAMITALKEMLEKEQQDNKELNMKNDTLKRWIAKRAFELGLSKHGAMQRKENESRKNSDHESIYITDESSLDEAPSLDSRDASPSKETTRMSPRAAQKPERNAPVLNTVTSRPKTILYTPWVVEQNESALSENQARGKGICERPNQENMGVWEAQAKECMTAPAGRVVIVPGGMVQASSSPPPAVSQNLPIYVAPYGVASQKTLVGGDTHENLFGTPHLIDPNNMAAIEALLKLGYEVKISSA